ncbi:MAG TPA: ABC transporter ATP-binding protein [Anaerolineae bacterium]|nr:ABC transporter ATP-binding protein [Anaerolineae bacterium]
MLQLDAIDSYYGRIQALRELSLFVNAGEIVALIGANGAGKTTLLNTISGLMQPRAGKIVYEGRDITKLKAVQVVRLGVSHVPEHRQLFGDMTVYENLLLGAYHRYRRAGKQTIRRQIAEVYDIFPILLERKEQLAGTLSGGEQQMLAIGRGLMADPRLILLDEPSLGLAPLIAQSLFEVIANLRENGRTVLLVEQNARAALRLADRAYVMENGRIALEGAAADLLSDERVQAAYLGH